MFRPFFPFVSGSAVKHERKQRNDALKRNVSSYAFFGKPSTMVFQHALENRKLGRQFFLKQFFLQLFLKIIKFHHCAGKSGKFKIFWDWKSWGGTFFSPLAKAIEKYTSSISVRASLTPSNTASSHASTPVRPESPKTKALSDSSVHSISEKKKKLWRKRLSAKSARKLLATFHCCKSQNCVALAQDFPIHFQDR